MGTELRSLVIGLVAVAVIVTALVLGIPRRRPPAELPITAVAASAVPSSRPVAPPFEMPSCPAAPDGAPQKGDPRVREAAQRGLAFLSRETRAWQKEHACYGCHVHAVTLEAMSVGLHNQYEVPRADMLQVVTGMQTLAGGAHGAAGFSYEGSSLLAPSQAFGGAAFARYDEWVDGDVRNDLMRTAAQLLAYQDKDGSIRLDWVNPPVGSGLMQGVFQATRTWRQAYARSADDKWLLPIQRAEGYMTAQARAWMQSPPQSLQDLDYALLGLTAAGVGSGEQTIGALERQLVGRQNVDGGWGFAAGDSTNAFATGQALYTLRTLGRADHDPIVAKGTAWLLEHQAKDGGWSHAGFGKAEAMWGVLGLVSVDVVSVAVTGIVDGQHAEGTLQLGVLAKDNQGGGVQRIEIAVDDVRVFGGCGGALSYGVNTAGLEAGKHLVDVTATNARGLISRRRLELYTGAVYLTQLGVNASLASTDVSLRDIAPAELGGTVTMSIVAPDGKIVATVSDRSIPGAITLHWNGATATGGVVPRGRYLARLALRDGKGQLVQTTELPFVHDTAEAQANDYGAIQGQLKIGAAAAANTEVELVDENDKIIGTTRSTASGQYRFKNVDAGKYKLRISKKGYAPVMKDVNAAKAEEQAADLQLK